MLLKHGFPSACSTPADRMCKSQAWMAPCVCQQRERRCRFFPCQSAVRPLSATQSPAPLSGSRLRCANSFSHIVPSLPSLPRCTSSPPNGKGSKDLLSLASLSVGSFVPFFRRRHYSPLCRAVWGRHSLPSSPWRGSAAVHSPLDRQLLI